MDTEGLRLTKQLNLLGVLGMFHWLPMAPKQTMLLPRDLLPIGL
jgi:hypothetical protein